MRGALSIPASPHLGPDLEPGLGTPHSCVPLGGVGSQVLRMFSVTQAEGWDWQLPHQQPKDHLWLGVWVGICAPSWDLGIPGQALSAGSGAQSWGTISPTPVSHLADRLWCPQAGCWVVSPDALSNPSRTARSLRPVWAPGTGEGAGCERPCLQGREWVRRNKCHHPPTGLQGRHQGSYKCPLGSGSAGIQEVLPMACRDRVEVPVPLAGSPQLRGPHAHLLCPMNHTSLILHR